jgi:hypothetical protein
VLSKELVPRDAFPSPRGLGPDRGTLVAAAAPLAHSREVVLAVTGRATPMRPFSPADARLLEKVAHQTGPNLHTAHLIEQLRVDALQDP